MSDVCKGEEGGGGSESGLEVYIVFTPKMRGGLVCVPYHQGICLPQPGTNVIPD